MAAELRPRIAARAGGAQSGAQSGAAAEGAGRPLTATRYALRPLVADLQTRALEVAGADPERHVLLPMPGAAAHGLEAALGTVVPEGGRILVLINGRRGRELERMASRLGIRSTVLVAADGAPVALSALERILRAVPSICALAMAHAERASGLLNPLDDILARLRGDGRRRALILDASASFGAVSLEQDRRGIDVLVATPEICLEATPGVALVSASRVLLAACEERARSHTLDLHAELRALERDGLPRFLPPTSVLEACRGGLCLLAAEGGVAGRARRYERLRALLREGLLDLGFAPCRPEGTPLASSLVVRAPRHADYDDARFRTRLASEGVSLRGGACAGEGACLSFDLRGRRSREDVQALVDLIAEALQGLGIGGRHAS